MPIPRYWSVSFQEECWTKRKCGERPQGGDRDITYLITPSHERALQLNKAYMSLVREQSFAKGRDAVLVPTENVFEEIVNGSTELNATGLVFRDGRLPLQ